MGKRVKFLKDIFDGDVLIWDKENTYDIISKCESQCILTTNLKNNDKYVVVMEDEGIVFEFTK